MTKNDENSKTCSDRINFTSSVALNNGRIHMLPDGIKVQPITPDKKPADFITVLTSINGKAIGKVIRYDDEKGLTKNRAPESGIYKAKTVSVSDLTTDLPPILESLNPSQALILGFVPGTEHGEEFTIWPSKHINQKLGIDAGNTVNGMFVIPGHGLVCGRFKSNFQASTVRLIDIDVSDEMPHDIRPKDLNHCLSMLNSVMPGLEEAAKIAIPSSSNRVVGEDGKPIFPSGSLHIYVQTCKHDDPDRWPTAIEVLAVKAGLHYEVSAKSNATGQELHTLLRYLWDTAPIRGSERLVYDSAPKITGYARKQGVRVIAPDIQIIKGIGAGRWNTLRIPTPNKAARDQFHSATGINMTIKKNGRPLKVKACLELDTVLETKDYGEMTVLEFWDSKYDHLRTQTLERESISWNGYLSRHQDRSPFAMDNGAGLKYVLTDDAKYDKLMLQIKGYSNDEPLPHRELSNIIAAIARARMSDTYDQALLDEMGSHKLTTLSKTEMKKMLKAIKSKSKDVDSEGATAHGDIGTHYADRLIRERYGIDWLGYSGGAFWQYTGTHWHRIDSEEVEAEVLKLLESDPPEGRSVFAILAKQIASLVALKVIGNLTIDLAKKRKPVVNCKNGEVWLTDDGPVLKQHDPATGLTYCSDIDYDLKAECPVYDKTVLGVFKKEGKHAKEMVRHIEEILGYGIQPERFIKVWVLGYGQGHNAKSSLFEIVQSIVGLEAYAPMRWDRDAHRSAFANAQLVGKLFAVDDDYDTNARLADGPLKAMSEEKLMSAEEKYEKRFEFMSTILPVILCNALPKSSDVTRALAIRVQTIPFRRNFLKPSECSVDHPDREDPSLFPHIIEHELPGVLNKLINGFYRLKERGDFDMPSPCRHLNNEFLENVNHLSAFIADRCQRVSEKITVGSAELYSEYIRWCGQNGIQAIFQISSISFSPKLEEMGFRKKRISEGVVICGLEIKPLDDFDDIDLADNDYEEDVIESLM